MVEQPTLFPTRSQLRRPCYCKPGHHQTVELTERSRLLVMLLPRRRCLLCCTRRFPPPVLACRVERWRRRHGRGWAAGLLSTTALSLVAAQHVEAGEWTGVRRRPRIVLRFRTSLPPALVFLALPSSSSSNKVMVHLLLLLLLFLGCRTRRCRLPVLRSQSLGNPDQRERERRQPKRNTRR